MARYRIFLGAIPLKVEHITDVVKSKALNGMDKIAYFLLYFQP